MSEQDFSERDERTPARQPAIRATESSDGAVLLDAHGGVLAALNATAYSLWQLCDGRTHVSEIVGAVAELFDLSAAQAHRDVARALDQLSQVGALVWDQEVERRPEKPATAPTQSD